jgi:hypothetical protein
MQQTVGVHALMMGGWASCSCPQHVSRAVQVLLLLKSSDRVAHDICHAYDACSAGVQQAQQQQQQHTLALRKWVNLKPEREFRCFVRARDLIGARCVSLFWTCCSGPPGLPSISSGPLAQQPSPGMQGLGASTAR